MSSVKTEKGYWWLSCILVLGLVFGVCQFGLAQQPDLSKEEKPIIQVLVETSTWKKRGRLLYDVEGSILKKLFVAGFHAVHEDAEPHQFDLVVNYQEERGPQYGVFLWGTTIHGSFTFRGGNLSEPFQWEIVETSRNVVSGVPPYLDALEKFETHPYYFFLGPILKTMTEGSRSSQEALKSAVTEQVFLAYPLNTESVSQEPDPYYDQYMDTSQTLYQEVGFQRALDDLLAHQVSDEELVPIAKQLLASVDPHSRIRAVQILGRSGNANFQERLRNVAKNDPDQDVRKAAKDFL